VPNRVGTFPAALKRRLGNRFCSAKSGKNGCTKASRDKGVGNQARWPKPARNKDATSRSGDQGDVGT